MSFPFIAKVPAASSQPEGWNRRMKRAFAAHKRRSRRHASRDVAARLVYEPLEPRLLLSADIMAVDLSGMPDAEVDNALLVRLVEEAETIGAQTVTVSMIEIVDEDTGDILETAELDGIREIRILTGAGNDLVRIDQGSFGDAVLPEISIDGGDGDDTLILTGGDAAQDWVIRGDDAGTMSGGLSGSFAGVETLIGSDDTDDHFTIVDGGSLEGGLDGGVGGYDLLTIDMALETLEYVAIDSFSGWFDMDGNVLTFAGLEPVEVTEASGIVSITTSGDDDEAILRADSGTSGLPGGPFDFEIVSQNASFESLHFNAPTSSVIIDLGDGDDTLFVADLGQDLTSDLVLQGGKGDDVIIFRDDLTMPGQSLIANAEIVAVGWDYAETQFGTGWLADQSFSDFAPTSATKSDGVTESDGEGLTIDITTDASGTVFLRITDIGEGYEDGDILTFEDPFTDVLGHPGGVALKLTLDFSAVTIDTRDLNVAGDESAGNSGNITFGNIGVPNVNFTTLDGRETLSRDDVVEVLFDEEILDYTDNAFVDHYTSEAGLYDPDVFNVETFELLNLETIQVDVFGLGSAAYSNYTAGTLGHVYEYIGADDLSFDLSQADFSDTSKWRDLGDPTDETNPNFGSPFNVNARTAATGEEFGLYSYKLNDNATIDLAVEDFTNTTRWQYLGNLDVLGQTAQVIIVNDGSKLLAGEVGATAFDGGDVQLKVEDIGNFTGQGFYNGDFASSRIIIGANVEITGADMELTALADTTKIFLDGDGEDFFSNAWTALASALESFSLFGGVAIAEASAVIDVADGASFTGSNFSAIADVTTAAESKPIGLGLAVAVAVVDSVANVNFEGDVDVSGNIFIRAGADNTASAIGDAGNFPVAISGASIGVGVTVLNSDVSAWVMDGATLTAGGLVTVRADTVDRTATLGRSRTDAEGTLGIGVAVSVTNGTTDALLDGTVHAGGNVTVEALSTESTVDSKALFVLPAVRGGVSASAGVGTDSTGELLTDTQNATTSTLTGALKTKILGAADDAGNSSNALTQTFDFGAAVAVDVNKHTATARIGDNTAAGGDGKVTSTGGNVTVHASVTARPDITAASSATQETDTAGASSLADGGTGSKFGGSVGVSVGDYLNEAKAYIGKGAEVDASGTIDVKANALNDYTPTYLVGIIDQVTEFDNNPDIDYDTTDISVTVQEFDIVRAKPGTTYAGGTANHAYRYTGDEPLDLNNFSGVDFTTGDWEDLGLLDVDHYSRDGSEVVNTDDIVRVSDEHPDDKGEGGELYRYIGISPGSSIDLANEDFTDDTEWESIGALGVSETIVGLIEELSGYFNSNLGVNGGLVDSWTQATASSDGFAIAGAVTVLNVDMTAQAWIGENAQINQDTTALTGVARSGTQEVLVSAMTANDGVHFGGNISLPNISTSGSSTGFSSFSVQPSAGGAGSTGGKGAVGAVVLVVIQDNTTEAEVRSGATVYADEMDVTATSSGLNLSITGSGGQSGDFGFNGVVTVFDIDNITHAVVETGAVLTIGSASVTPGADMDQTLNIAAVDDTILIQLAGAVSYGSGVGVGATVSINSIDRDTRAVIGNVNIKDTIDAVDDGEATAPATIAQTVDAVGGVSVSAENTGLVIAVAISAAVSSPNAGPNTSSPSAQTESRTGSKFGGGVSANVSLNNINDTALAYVHDAKVDGASLDIDAVNDTSIYAVSGSVAVSTQQGTSASLAGAYSQNTIDLRTLTMLDNADVDVGSGAVDMNAMSASGILSIGVSGAVSTSSSSLSVAGQVSYNDIDMLTSSRVTDSSVDGGSLSVVAFDESQIFTVAGAVAFGGKAGIGASVAVNLIGDIGGTENNVSNLEGGISASITNSDVDTSGSVSLSGFSGTQIIGIAAAVSAATGPLAASVAVVVNEIDVTTEVYVDGKLTSDGMDAANLFLSAYDNAAIGSVAGGVGISGGTAGIGASVAVNTITNDTSAFIKGDADIDVTGDVNIDANSDSYILSVAIAGAGASTAAIGGSVAVNSVGTTGDTATTEAVIRGSAIVAADGNVLLAAQNEATLTTIAGAVAIAGTAGVGLANSTVVTNRQVLAEIKGTAQVTGLGNNGSDTVQTGFSGARATDTTFRGISVTSEAELDVVTVAIGGAGGGSAAVAGSATVSTIDDTVKARVATGTKLNEVNTGANADQGINVFAYNQTDIIGSAGGVSGSGTFGGTAGADVGVIDKTTIAELSATDANVRDLVSVQAVSTEDVVSVSATVAIGGSVGLAGAAGVYLFGASGADPMVTRAFIGANADIFTEGTVLVAANQETNADFFVGGVSASLGGAVGVTAGVSVINKLTEAYVGDNAKVVAESLSGRDTAFFAMDFDAATFSADNASDDTEVSPPAGLTVGDEDGDGNADSSNGSLFEDRNVNVDYEARNGVSITATNTDEFEALIIAVGGGAVSGQVSALAVVGNIATHAYVGNGATVDATGGSSTTGDVNIAALNDYHAFFIAAPISVSLSGGVSAGAAVNVLNLDTRAVIGDEADIDADNDVRLVAESEQDLLVTAASVGVSGGIGVALAGVYVDINSTTQAYVRDDSPDAAGGDVGIDADGDNDKIGASITAGNNVVVSADDDTAILNIGGALGVGIGGGGAGAGFTVATISKDTQAYIGDWAVVDAFAKQQTDADLPDTLNTGLSNSEITGVVVVADSSEMVDSFAVAAAGGFAVGIAGALSVVIVDSDTTAGIKSNTKINTTDQSQANAQQDVYVGATNRAEFFTIGAGLSISLGGSVGAGVDIGVVRNDVSAYIGGEVNARDSIGVDADSEKTLLSVAATASVGLVGISAAVSVWSVGSDFSESDVSGRKDDSDSSFVDSGDLEDIEDRANDDAVPSDLTDTLDGYGDDNSSSTGDNTDPENDALMAGAMTSASSSLSGSSPSVSFSEVTTAPGVSAFVLAGANITAGDDINIEADEDIRLNVLAGGVAAGLAGFGASVSVVNVSSNVQAYVEDGASPATGATLDAGDDLKLRANYFERTDVISFAGQGGLVAGGGAIVFVNSSSAQSSYVGNHTEITDADRVILDTDADIGVTGQTIQASVGLVSAGIAVVDTNVTHTTTAKTGSDVIMGSASDKIRELDITADSTIEVTADTVVIGASLGASVSANASNATATSTVDAGLGARSKVFASGDVEMRARASGDISSDLQGTTVSGLASIASSNANASWTNTVTTELGDDVEIYADDISLAAYTNHNSSGTIQSSKGVSVNATSSAAAALAIGAGTVATASQTTDAKVEIGAGIVITAASLTGVSKSRNNVDATVDDLAAGIVGIGIPIASATVNNESEVTTKNATSADVSQFNISGTLKLEAISDTDADAIVESEAYGLGAAAVGSATTTLSRNDTIATLGNYNIIGSDAARAASVELLTDNSFDLDAEMEITAAGAVTDITANATVNAGRGGTPDGLNKVGMGSNSEIYATDVKFYAKDDRLDVRSRADSDVDFALGGSVDAFAIGDIRAQTLVELGTNAVIDAEENVDLFSKQFGVKTDVDALTAILGASGNLTSDATAEIRANSNITANSGAVVTGRFIDVEAETQQFSGDYSKVAETDAETITQLVATVVGETCSVVVEIFTLGIADGDEVCEPVIEFVEEVIQADSDAFRRGSEVKESTITWNADVNVRSEANPFITINADGTVVASSTDLANAVSVDANTATIPDIRNTSTGTLRFDATGSTSKILSTEAVVFNLLKSYENVTIINNSDRDLIIQGISVWNKDQTVNDIEIDVAIQTDFPALTEATFPTATKGYIIETNFDDSVIDIEAKGAGDIIFKGAAIPIVQSIGGMPLDPSPASVENPGGTTNVTAAEGDILMTSGDDATIQTRRLVMSALKGSIGEADTSGPIAYGDIRVELVQGTDGTTPLDATFVALAQGDINAEITGIQRDTRDLTLYMEQVVSSQGDIDLEFLQAVQQTSSIQSVGVTQRVVDVVDGKSLTFDATSQTTSTFSYTANGLTTGDLLVYQSNYVTDLSAVFDPKFDIALNVIELGFNHGLETGQALIYTADISPADGVPPAPVVGLTDGATYYVINAGASKIKLAASKADANAGTEIVLDTSGLDPTAIYAPARLASAPTVSFQPVLTVSNDELDFGTAHGMSTGQAVIYTADTVADNFDGNEIGGLVDGRTYYVIKVNNTKIQLAESYELATTGGGTALQLDESLAQAAISFTPGAITEEPTSIVFDPATAVSPDLSVLSFDPATDVGASPEVVSFTPGLDIENTTAQFTFDPSGAVANDTITLTGNHGYADGDAVIYTTGSDVVGGLTSGTRYFAIVVSATEIQLAATRADATAGTPVAITLDTTSTTGTDHAIQKVSGDTISFLSDHGFTDGQALSYDANGFAAIGSVQMDGSILRLADGATVYAIVVDADTIQIAANATDAGNNTAIALDASVGFASGHTFTAPVGAGVVSDGISFASAHGLTTGDAVVYGNGGMANTNIGNLVSGETYYVIVVDTDTVKLAANAVDATNGTAIDIDETAAGVAPGGDAGGDHTLTVVTSVVPNAITSATDHGFETGDTAIYSKGSGAAIGGLEDGDSYYVIKISDTVLQLAATLSDAFQNKAINLDETAASANDHSLTAPQEQEANVITFAAAHGFKAGQAVQYIRSGGSTDVGGLTSDGTPYYVIVVSETQIQLAATQLDATSATRVPIDLDGTVADGSSHTIAVLTSDHALTLSGDLGGLKSGVSYAVVGETADTFQLAELGSSTAITVDSTVALGTGHTLIGDSFIITTVQRDQITFASSDADADVVAAAPGDLTATGIKAAGSITVTGTPSANAGSQSVISIAGNIDVDSDNNGTNDDFVTIHVIGDIDLREVSGDFRIGTVRALDGDITLEAANGDIIDVNGGSLDIYSDTPGVITLIADMGAIGEAGDALQVDSASVNATARDSIWMDETAGSMNVTNATSVSGDITLNATDSSAANISITLIQARAGDVTLNATGGIYDAQFDTVADIEANNIDMTAQTAAIGASLGRLEIDSSYASNSLVTLNAITGAFIEEVAGTLFAGAMTVTTGTLNMRVRDSAASGEDYVQTNAVISAQSITIDAADDVTIGANASITGTTGGVSISADDVFSDPDAAGATVMIDGIISANTVASITTGEDADTVSIEGSLSGLTGVAIDTGGANDTVTTGVAGSVDDNNTVIGAVTSANGALSIDTGAGNDTITVHVAADATGNSLDIDMRTGNDTLTVSGELRATAGAADISMDDATGGDDAITVATNAFLTSGDAMTIGFGDGTNGLDIDGTVTGKSVAITSGTGVDTFEVAGNSLTSTAGAITMTLGAGADTVAVTGLVQSTGGNIDIDTGADADTLDVSGTVDADQKLIIETAGGNDTVLVQSGGTLKGADVEISTGSGSDTLTVETTGLIEAETGRVDIDMKDGADTLSVHGEILAATVIDIQTAGAADTVFVDGELDAPVIEIGTGGDMDLVTLDGADLNGATTVSLGDDDDTFYALLLATPTDGGPGDLTVDGGSGSDDYYISLTGNSDYRMVVADSGALTSGVDELDVSLTSNADTFLIRSNFVALLQGDVTNGFGPGYERIDYDGNLNERVRVRAFEGDDAFYVDDTSAVFTLDGGLGEDAFQIGQVFGTDPNVAGNLAAGDDISVQQLDEGGFLSRGISLPMVIFGGEGNDDFSVFSNKADLRLEGEGGDDNFVVRAFLLGNDLTEIDGGVGSDFIQYNINAPVSIEGGDGTDQVIVVGTSAPDNFLITRDGIFGAGLSVTFSGVEIAKVDGLEGDDQFFIQSTSKDVLTVAVGGLGSDTFNITGDITGAIAASELDGARSSINHNFAGADTDYLDAGAAGIDLTVANASDSPISITPSGADTSVFEDDATSIDSYTVTLTGTPAATVFVTISASLASSTVKAKDLELTFDDAANTITTSGSDWDALGFAAGQKIQIASGANAGNYVIASLSGTQMTVETATLTDTTETSDVIGTKIEDEGSQTVQVSIDGGTTWARASVLTLGPGTLSADVMVRAVSDIVQEGLTSVFISHDAQSDDATYNDAAIASIEVLVKDDDIGGVQITETNGGTHILEGLADGTNAIIDSYDIRLTKAPDATVTVTVSEEAGYEGYLEFSLNGTDWFATLDVVFDAASVSPTDWSTDQTVLVRGTPDTSIEDDRRVYIQHTIASSDTLFAGAEAPEVVVLAQDDDKAGLFVSETDGNTRLVVGTTAATTVTDSYTMRLTSAPTDDVTVQLFLGGKVNVVSANTFGMSDDRLVEQTITDANGNSVQVQTIVFTSSNWNQDVVINLEGDLSAGGTFADGAPKQNLHLANAIEGQIDIIGGVEFGTDFSLKAAVMLPYETNGGIPGATGSGTADTDDTLATDRVNVFDDASTEDQTGILKGLDPALSANLTFAAGTPAAEQERSSITGLDMRTGISFRDVEIAEVLMGDGNDTFLVDGRHQADGDHGGMIVIHGAGGNDMITVQDGATPTGGSDARVVIFGDTSEDAARYDAPGGVPSPDALGFNTAGDDTIDASGASFTVALDGGDGNDTITGSSVGDHIAGGRGDDTIVGGSGNDHIYGDNAFNIDPVLRDLTVVAVDTAGSDDITDLSGDNIIFGDMGQIDLVSGTVRIDTTDSVIGILTLMPLLGAADIIRSGSGKDTIMGGNAGDDIDAGDGANLILGDHGSYNIASNGDVTVQTTDADNGGADTITTGSGDDMVFAGAAGDTVTAGEGENLILGDYGSYSLTAAGALTIQTTDADNGGADTITTGSGDDMVFAGAAGDTVTAGEGENLILGDYGSYSLASNGDVTIQTTDADNGGADTITTGSGDDMIFGGTLGDTLTAGAGENLILGDHGRYALTGTAVVIETTDETNEPAIAGSDVILSGVGADIVLGGGLGDDINTTGGDDIVLGDHGTLTGDTTGWSEIVSTDPTAGGNDTIRLGEGNDIAIGGGFADLIIGQAGNDLIFGDFGDIDTVGAAYITGAALPLDEAISDFVFTSIFTSNADDGGADIIFGDDIATYTGADSNELDASTGAGDDIILGGQAGDVIHAGFGDDDIIGGHNVAGGQDGADRIDGGGGSDAIAGDNAQITRKGDAISERFRELAGDEIYGEELGVNDGDALIDGVAQANPDGGSERTILILDALASLGDTTIYGDDVIAGGADDDTIFGQFGDDIIQGDGGIGVVSLAGGAVIDSTTVLLPGDSAGVADANFTADASRDTSIPTGVDETIGLLSVDASFELSSDGDDYIEGNAGADVVFGNLGRDDIIGGSSSLYGLSTPAERPDGDDFLFGGAGTQIDRDTTNDLSAPQAHGRDSDVIVGDNGNIYRLVDDTGDYLNFAYDTYLEVTALLPRAVEFLDYTEGDQFAANIGGADEIHGEDGDDTAYGMTGNDILFGERQNDDLIGGLGNDWISGGAGVDGVIGDDGRIYTSRNGTAEDLYGIDATSQEVISTRENGQYAIIHVTDELKKAVNITPFVPGTIDDSFNDIIFGGLGDDFLHGAVGDDAISGAEAIDLGYAEDSDGTIYATGYLRPYTPADILDYDVKATGDIEFWLFDENDPLSRITVTVDGAEGEFFLNNNAGEGPDDPRSLDGVTVQTDGDDRIFGDLGNDWLVGGTGRDNLYGGRGGDLMNVDDDLTTAGGTNQGTDTSPGYEDRAFGGAGQDILIGNTGGDRLIDWNGELNSYFLPFSAYGEPTVARLIAQQLPEFLYALSEADGADQTLADEFGGQANRNGEPFGEIGLVRQGDADWNDQSGPPVDPQPGNGKAPRDVTVTSAPGGVNDLSSPDVSGDFGGSADPLTAASKGEGGSTLSQAQAEAAFVDAVNWWSTTDPDAATLLGTVDVVIADLANLALGAASEGLIIIDSDAAGHGWFFDETPETDDDLSEDEMDLFSAMVHEVGHLLGYEHGDLEVMEEVLEAGVRTTSEDTQTTSARILPFSTPTAAPTRPPVGLIDQTPALSRGPMLKEARLGDRSFVMNAQSGDLVPDFDVYDPHDGKSTFEFDEMTGLLTRSAG